MGRSRASVVYSLHLGFHRQAEGRAALDRWLHPAFDPDHEMDVRLQAERCFLVHGGRRLDHRPHLRLLRSACGRRHAIDFRRRADLSGRDPLLAHDPGSQSQHFLYCTDRDPFADQARRQSADEIRPVVAAPARHRRRADQSRSVDVVPRNSRPATLPDRRYLVADRNRRSHDHAAARRSQHQAGFMHPAPARHHGRHR